MSLSTSIVRILCDKNCKAMNFHIAGLHVNGQGLEQVAGRIVRGDIAICPRANMKTPARYRFARDEIHVSNDLSQKLGKTTVKAVIVHEGVHALSDLKRMTAMTGIESESAGFLAQAFYRLKARNGRKYRSSIDIFSAAQDIIFDLKLLETRGQTVKWEDYESLRKAIESHPNYADDDHDEKGFAKGIKRHNKRRCRI